MRARAPKAEPGRACYRRSAAQLPYFLLASSRGAAGLRASSRRRRPSLLVGRRPGRAAADPASRRHPLPHRQRLPAVQLLRRGQRPHRLQRRRGARGLPGACGGLRHPGAAVAGIAPRAAARRGRCGHRLACGERRRAENRSISPTATITRRPASPASATRAASTPPPRGSRARRSAAEQAAAMCHLGAPRNEGSKLRRSARGGTSTCRSNAIASCPRRFVNTMGVAGRRGPPR